MLVTAHLPLAEFLNHDVLGRSDVPMVTAVAGYSGGWLLMVAAMMLPVALMLAGPAGRTGRWLFGYLGAWLLAGFVFAWLDLVLHAVVGASRGWPADLVRSTVGIAGAGLSLRLAWREATSVHGAREHAARHGSLGDGWLHGLHCVRTCGAMMLAVQALAPGDLVTMAVAAACLGTVRLRLLAPPAR